MNQVSFNNNEDILTKEKYREIISLKVQEIEDAQMLEKLYCFVNTLARKLLER